MSRDYCYLLHHRTHRGSAAVRFLEGISRFSSFVLLLMKLIAVVVLPIVGQLQTHGWGGIRFHRGLLQEIDWRSPEVPLVMLVTVVVFFILGLLERFRSGCCFLCLR